MNIDKINKLVISLPSREDRLLTFNKEYNKLFKDNYTIIDGVIDSIPYKGIAKAHINAITHAKNNNWDYVIIMEDDLKISNNNAKQYFEKALENITFDFDILLGGVYNSKNIKYINEYWSKTETFCGLQLYLVNNKAYDKIINYSFDSNQHIDRWLADTKYGNLNTYFTNKFFALQYNGYSDNAQQIVDYDYLIKKNRLL